MIAVYRYNMSLSNHNVSISSTRILWYNGVVPKLWNETIEAHRREVHDAILDTTWALIAEHGLLSVRMSQIAEKTGIGRATRSCTGGLRPDLPRVPGVPRHRTRGTTASR